MKIAALIALSCVALGAWSQPCMADEGKLLIGLKPLGFSASPDQYTVGVQTGLGWAKFARFKPGVDIGFGDHTQVTTFNLDVERDVLSLPGTRARFYLGAGPAISRISPDEGESDTEIGFSLLGGLKIPFSELHYYDLLARAGFGDIPEFKLQLGVNFGFGQPSDADG